MKIILGSQSKGRKQILEEMGFKFEVVSPNIDEKSIRFDDPQKLTLALAHAKADALLSRIPKDVILITSDQVVVCNGVIREKPESETEAREFLESYAHTPAQTVTAVVVTNAVTGARREGVDIAKIFFAPIPENVISAYIASGDPYNQAGGFSTSTPLLKEFIARIDGAEDSIIGLPKELTKKLVNQVTNGITD